MWLANETSTCSRPCSLSFRSRVQQHAYIYVWDPYNQKVVGRRNFNVLSLFRSRDQQYLRLAPLLSEMWMVDETLKWSLSSAHVVDNTHTSALGTPVIRNVVDIRIFNVLLYSSTMDIVNVTNASLARFPSSYCWCWKRCPETKASWQWRSSPPPGTWQLVIPHHS